MRSETPSRPSRLLGAWVLFLSAVCTPAAADPPGDLMEQRALAYVEAFNSGDAGRMLAFVEESFARTTNRTDEERRAQYERMREDLGKLEVENVELPGGPRLILEARAARGPVTFEFQFEEGPPHRIVQIALEVGGRGGRGPRLPPVPIPDGATEDEIRAAVDGYVGDLAARDEFAGVVSIVEGGRTLFQKAYGEASRRFGVPNTPSTRFRVGSITKTFTQVAIAKLAEEGRLRLDDTIADHLPDYPSRKAARKITIDQLAHHTSGLPDIFTEEYFDTPKDRLTTPSDYIAIWGKQPLQFEPGERQSYSNLGYIVLGAIIEKVTGMSYPEYVRRVVFEPAGMSASGFFRLDGEEKDLAVGYTRFTEDGERGEAWRSNEYLLPVVGGPDGGSYSPVGDLIRFQAAFRGFRLLSPGWTRWVYGGKPPEDAAAAADPAPLEGEMADAGGAPGVSTLMIGGGERMVYVLANVDEPIAEEVGESIFRALQEFRAGAGPDGGR